MGGSGGGVIVRNSAVQVLNDPQVHGVLPQGLQDLVDPVLAKPEDQWDAHDKVIVAHVYSWALCNLG